MRVLWGQTVQELISPQQSEMAVLIASLIVALVVALGGFRLCGVRGLALSLLGPLLFGLWQLHKWITRYDSQSGYFGLDKVWVLLLEVALFVVFGAVSGVLLRKILKPRISSNEHR